MLDVPPPSTGHVPVSPRTRSPPVLIGPVAKVVSTFPAGTRPVGDFVPAQTSGGGQLINQHISLCRDIIIRSRDRPSPHVRGQTRPLLHDEGVRRQVVNARLNHG